MRLLLLTRHRVQTIPAMVPVHVSFWTERKMNSVGSTSAIKQIRNITKEEAEEILAAFCSGYPDLTKYNETMQRLREQLETAS